MTGPRMNGRPRHDHAEAFALMWYACDRCGARERIWNSRDGVTPFAMPCPSCGGNGLTGGMVHVDFHLDEYAPDHKPAPGQRMWVSMTREAAEAYTERRIALMQQRRAMPPSVDLETARRMTFDFIYQDGQAPDLAIAGYVRGDA